MKTSKIIVTCSPRVNSIVEQEIIQLGYKNISTSHQSVSLTGTFTDTIRLNLLLRTANRVLFEISSFTAKHPDELYKNINKIEWDTYFDVDGFFSIKSFVSNEYINDIRFANLRAKDAIVDYFNKKYNKRPDSGNDLSKTVLFLHWQDTKASIYIDTSGETIAKHGYRKIPLQAPMMESLAAASILSSVWDRKSHFINPMCGSGTLAIEAVLIAMDKYPAVHRTNFGFMHVKQYNPEEWENLKNDIIKKEKENIDGKIIATDMNPAAIVAARQNAIAAGVESLITFKTCDFRDTEVPDSNKGVIFMNPEYGQRLGEEKELEQVYKNIGDFFKQQGKGYMGYIFTGNMNLAKRIGLRTRRRMEFYNGKIDCRLLEYELYEGTKKMSKLDK